MRGAAVVIPWFDSGCPHRRRAFTFVRRHWETLGGGVPVLVWSSPSPFRPTVAVNDAIRATPGLERILRVDADCIVQLTAARRALELAGDAPGLVIAHDHYRYLDARSTERVLTRSPFALLYADAEFDEQGTKCVGGAVAFSRATWEAVGGCDERFAAWGGDDAAFSIACEGLAGPIRRVPGELLHLWHPPPPERDPAHQECIRSMSLIREYQDAAAVGPRGLLALIERTRDARWLLA